MCSKPFAIAPVAMMLALSCSVLEDRSDCPCELVIDLSDEKNFSADKLSVRLTSGDFSYDTRVSRDEYPVPLLVRVPRAAVSVSVMDSATDAMNEGGSLVIPPGEQCPVVYMYNGVCDCSDEQALEYVRLRKNYCGVSLSFVAADPQKYRMSIEGNICGYDNSGRPLEGEFEYDPDFDASSRCYFRLPRQTDRSLWLLITGSSGVQRRLSLGTFIHESGYDWHKEDLDDLIVSIDYASLQLKISVDEWSVVVEDDVVI